MSKQILNQRYCYRLNSNFIARSKGKVKTPSINTAIKQRYIVGIGDSNGTRICRKLLNNKCDEDYINNLKNELYIYQKEYIKNPNKELKKNIYNKLKEIKESSLQDYICNVEFNSKKHYREYSKNGFYLNGKKYDILLGTPGGIKKSIAMFVRSDIIDELEVILNNGAKFDIEGLKVLPNKIMGYKSLTFSSSTPVKWTDRILVVKDVETLIHKDVIEVRYGDEEGEEPYTRFVKDKEILINACDGCGLIRPSLAKEWAYEYLQEDYVPTSMCIRCAWTKGIVTKFDFEDYCVNELNTIYVTDVWGNKHDIRNVDLVLNESMLKLNTPYYDSIEDYIFNCKKNYYEMSITKYSPKKLDNERTLNYQYIQCLDLKESDLDELLENNISEIKDVLGMNPTKTILFGKGKELNDKNVWFSKDSNDNHIKALMINKKCIEDDFVTTKVKRAIKKKINQLKTGKIKVNGNYQIAIGEPIVQLQHMCGKEVNGLLNEDEFYIKYWQEKGVKRVAGFRSPMSCKENAKVMKVANNKKINKYYGDLYGVIIFNAKDTSMMAFNGEDFDGDINFTTDNPIILKGVKNLPALDCETQTSIKIHNPSKQDYINAIENSFGNKVGSVTNTGSCFYDKQALFKKDSYEYKELDKRIQIIQLIQQSCIDSAKNGKPPEPIPNYWYDDKCDKIKINKEKLSDGKYYVLDDEETVKEKEKLLSMCAYKKPYYFRYIYSDSDLAYRKYIKEVNAMCLREFELTLDELKNKKRKTKAEKERLNYFLEKNPLSDNKCLVNIIAHKVEKEFDDIIIKENKNKNFDYSIYMSEDIKSVDRNTIIKIKKVYKDYMTSLKHKNSINYIFADKEDKTKDSKQALDILKDDLLKIEPNEEYLANILIYLSYEKNVVSKTFVWTFVGDSILKIMLKKSNDIIKYPIKDKNGYISYDGDKFIEKELEIKEEF